MGATGGKEGSRRYYIGVDLAKVEDFTALVALDEDGHVRGFDRFHQLDWTFQVQRIRAFAEEYNGLIIVDSTGVGDPIYESLYRTGLRVQPYKFTSESKRQLIENLSIRFDAGQLSIPGDLEVLLNELKAYTYEMLPSGRVRYGAPEGLHDDAVTAFALAAWGRWRGEGVKQPRAIDPARDQRFRGRRGKKAYQLFQELKER
jgi:phage FluMu gp28-like protein